MVPLLYSPLPFVLPCPLGKSALPPIIFLGEVCVLMPQHTEEPKPNQCILSLSTVNISDVCGHLVGRT